ncbi:FAD-dependent tricarballylate dehydrogenase TcuA [Saccharopolyspora cebuensis]|uniref:FAD-dependent tricarballylate dehydrogenase TcuA n=2 Tax=Saccharopolyspora cebuensis TaxID=418759 RepID=A0ABV4CCW7_9PSEU
MGERVDVVVVGGGNAGFCAAHAAAEQGARVLVLEKAPAAEAGGNSYYTAGAFRFALDGLDDIADLLDDETTRQRLADTELPPYPREAFAADMHRVTEGRCDPVLTDVLVSRSASAVRWLADKGIRWRLMYERQAYVSGDAWVFFGGLYVGTVDGGKGLIAQHAAAAERAGIEVRCGAEVVALHLNAEGDAEGNADGRGVSYRDAAGAEHRVSAGAVVLAAGGFEADPARRAEHLGVGWEHAYVRGTGTNTGEVLDLALAAGAAPHGDWGSCHSTAWDAGADPVRGDRELTNQLTRQSYPIGIVVNRDGQRFLDEGADFRNYTYAKYGREILRQPGGRGFQLFDARTRPLLRTEEYDSRPISETTADTLDELAARAGIDADGLRRTVAEFNAAIVDVPFDPAVKDGRAARVDPPKSNWAQPLDTPPYYAYAVGCGITFTFGGLHVDPAARVLDTAGAPIDGLYAAGELVGGLFSGNYPGGSGLTSGAVFGRLAGRHAAGASPED